MKIDAQFAYSLGDPSGEVGIQYRAHALANGIAPRRMNRIVIDLTHDPIKPIPRPNRPTTPNPSVHDMPSPSFRLGKQLLSLDNKSPSQASDSTSAYSPQAGTIQHHFDVNRNRAFYRNSPNNASVDPCRMETWHGNQHDTYREPRSRNQARPRAASLSVAGRVSTDPTVFQNRRSSWGRTTVRGI